MKKVLRHVNTKLIIEELHRAFNMFNSNLFENKLPEPAILIQSRGNKKLTLGWCTVEKVWKNNATHEERYEINLVAEALNRGIYPVMATLLHEMVHLHNLVYDIKDTSRGFTYHNTRFKKVAEAHGLTVEHGDKIGWGYTSLQGLTMDLIDSYEFNPAVFSMGRVDLFTNDDETQKKKTSSRKYECPVCKGTLRTSRDMNILCGDCTNVEKGIIVKFIKVEGEGAGEQEAPEESSIEYVCKDCGSISQFKENESPVCKECGGLNIVKMEDAPTEEVSNIVDVDSVLIDGDGKKVPVKQRKIQINETEWDLKTIQNELKRVSNKAVKKGLEKISTNLEIEISEKFISGYAKYKEGKKIVFSKEYLDKGTDEHIKDTIAHEFLHHYEYVTKGLKSNHQSGFKELCKLLGIETKVPVKNHRAMK